jgi:DNA-binding response OmpR family regulator
LKKIINEIVEDEVKTGNYLREGLQEAGYSTDLVRNGLDGLHLVLTWSQELIQCFCLMFLIASIVRGKTIVIISAIVKGRD